MHIYDISLPITPGATHVYPGDPGIEFEAWASFDKGDPANVTMLHFGAHTGTHIDAPAHFIEGGAKVIQTSLNDLIGEAQVVEISSDVTAIEAAHVESSNIEGARRIIFKTRNSGFWDDMQGGFRKDFTYITPEAADALVRLGVRLVGFDYLSVEKFGSEDFATHKTLLSHGAIILEGLDLRAVAAGRYELICLPLKLDGGDGDGAPCRAALRALER